MIGPKIAVPVALAAIAGFGLKANDIRPTVNPAVRQNDLSVHEQSATASLMGQFRTSVSAWLWLRTDLYLHNGTEMRPLSESEKQSGVSVEGAADDGNEQLTEENEITTVPPKDRDFRGFFGDVEREVASYRDMHHHDHNEPLQALPLFRLMTWLDPQFVQGWTTGAMVMARNRNPEGTRLAVQFLREGWAANPDSFELPSMIGYTIYTRHGALSDAIGYLEDARTLAIKAKDVIVTEEAKDVVLNNYRWLAMCYRDSGKPEQERRTIAEGLTIFKDDPVLIRLIRRER